MMHMKLKWLAVLAALLVGCGTAPQAGQVEMGVPITALSFAADGQSLVLVGEGTLARLGVPQLNIIWKQTLDQPLNGVAWAPDGTWLATAGDDGHVRIWRARDGQAQQVLPSLQDWASSVAISPDGKLLAAGSLQAIHFWSTATWQPLGKVSTQRSYIWELVFSPDGEWLVSTSTDQTAALWRVADVLQGLQAQSTPQAERVLRGSTYWVRSAAFAPSGELLGAASGDGAVYLWEVATGERLLTLSGHNGYVWSVAFRPDGKGLLSAAEDGRMILWDAQSGQELERINHSTGVRAAVYSADGRWLAFGDAQGTVALRPLR